MTIAVLLDLTWLRSAVDNVGGAGLLGAIAAGIAGIAEAAAAAGSLGHTWSAGMENAGRMAAAASGLGHYATVDATVGPGVQVGGPGAWRDAAPGMQIGPDDYLKVPPGSQATVTTIDGFEKDIVAPSARGVVVPGSWVNGADSEAGGEFAQHMQRAADDIVGPTVKTKGNSGSKA